MGAYPDRQYDRKIYQTKILFSYRNSPLDYNADMLNRSVNGASIQIDASMQPGEEIFLKMPEYSATNFDLEPYRAKVIWCRKCPETQKYTIGLEYLMKPPQFLWFIAKGTVKAIIDVAFDNKKRRRISSVAL